MVLPGRPCCLGQNLHGLIDRCDRIRNARPGRRLRVRICQRLDHLVGDRSSKNQRELLIIHCRLPRRPSWDAEADWACCQVICSVVRGGLESAEVPRRSYGWAIVWLEA